MKWTRASEDKKPEKGQKVCGKILYKSKTHHLSYIGFGWVYYSNAHRHKLTTSAQEKGYRAIVQEWLDESDESPESSVWPGEEEVKQAAKDAAFNLMDSHEQPICKNKKEAQLFERGFVFAINFWLQSRIAVKAEVNENKFIIVAALLDYLNQFQAGEISLSRFAELLNQDAYNWYRNFVGELLPTEHPDERHPRAGTWLQERRNWISEVDILRAHIEKQSQPTAGGVKEEELYESNKKHILQIIKSYINPGMTEELFDELALYFHNPESQPPAQKEEPKEGEQTVPKLQNRVTSLECEIEYLKSELAKLKSSNPSIKRPTEEEIHVAYIKVLDKWRYGNGEFVSREEFWNAAINWLLSIQPYKA